MLVCSHRIEPTILEVTGVTRDGVSLCSLPPGPTSRGSSATATVLPAIRARTFARSHDPEIVRLRVTRWVTVIDGGQVINKTARNQILGSIVMGTHATGVRIRDLPIRIEKLIG